jgi:hypothetical protein
MPVRRFVPKEIASPDVNQTVQERAGCQDYRTGSDPAAILQVQFPRRELRRE